MTFLRLFTAIILIVFTGSITLQPHIAIAAEKEDEPLGLIEFSQNDNNKPVTHGELKKLIKNIIMEEPEMIMGALRSLRKKQEDAAKQSSAEAFERNKTELIADTESPSVGGSETPDVTVIEFFDYHCGYCKRIVPTITKILQEDKKVRFIFREYPILSEESVYAARAALAVNSLAPEKYFDYHKALMKRTGKLTPDVLLKAAEKLGIDKLALKKEMDTNKITEQLEKNRNIGKELSVRGTPAIFVGDKMMPGAIPYGTLKRLIGEAREKNKAINGAADTTKAK